MEKELLTIAIPTFNRHEVLLKNIEILLDNYRPWIKILVIDNYSDPCVEDFVFKNIQINNNVKIEFKRNLVNVGGNSNVLKCIEYCDTEYIWVLGDDDYPVYGFPEIVYSYIKEELITWISFYQEDNFQPVRLHESCHENINTFLSSFSSINELVFISTNVYKTSVLKTGIEAGYFYQATMVPHLVSMLSGIDAGLTGAGLYVISNKKILFSVSNNKDPVVSWALYKAFVGVYSIVQIPFNKNVSDNLIVLINGAKKKWLNNRSLIYAFSRLSQENGVRMAYKMSSSFIANSFVIEGFKSIITIFLYSISILFGRFIIAFNKVLKKLH
jgi:abequosyltransferase